MIHACLVTLYGFQYKGVLNIGNNNFDYCKYMFTCANKCISNEYFLLLPLILELTVSFNCKVLVMLLLSV